MIFCCSFQVVVSEGGWGSWTSRCTRTAQPFYAVIYPRLINSFVQLLFELITHGVHGHAGQGASAGAYRAKAVLKLSELRVLFGSLTCPPYIGACFFLLFATLDSTSAHSSATPGAASCTRAAHDGGKLKGICTLLLSRIER